MGVFLNDSLYALQIKLLVHKASIQYQKLHIPSIKYIDY